jgi:hypothetical protein
MMNREIKFRGRNNSGKWVYGFYVARSGDHKTKHYIYTGKTSSNEPDWCEKYEVDPETVGQFTTLDNKSGKEIYEDDVIKSGMTGATYLICWSDENLGWYKQMLGIDTNDRPIHQDGSSQNTIGNIHENPELLS